MWGLSGCRVAESCLAKPLIKYFIVKKLSDNLKYKTIILKKKKKKKTPSTKCTLPNELLHDIFNTAGPEFFVRGGALH
jgi:hypothetical protein